MYRTGSSMQFPCTMFYAWPPKLKLALELELELFPCTRIEPRMQTDPIQPLQPATGKMIAQYTTIAIPTRNPSKQIYLPLRQGKDVITLRTLRDEARNAEPAGLAVIGAAVRRADDVFDDFLAGGSRLQLGFGAEAAGDGQAGERVGGRGAEGTGGLGDRLGHAQAGAERVQE